MTLREAWRDLSQPKLRFVAPNVLVHLPLSPGETHHLFISHVWGSAQDQARVLRSQLQTMVPGLRVWLDVEDLVDISTLEQAVDTMQAVVIIVSSGCEWLPFEPGRILECDMHLTITCAPASSARRLPIQELHA